MEELDNLVIEKGTGSYGIKFNIDNHKIVKPRFHGNLKVTIWELINGSEEDTKKCFIESINNISMKFHPTSIPFSVGRHESLFGFWEIVGTNFKIYDRLVYRYARIRPDLLLKNRSRWMKMQMIVKNIF